MTYRSGISAGRGSHASGEAEWSMRGVGNLTRAAYAILRIWLHLGIANFSYKSRVCEMRYVVIRVACLQFVFCRAFGDASSETWILRLATFSLPLLGVMGNIE